MLEHPELDGWRDVIRGLGALSVHERAAIEQDILALANVHVTERRAHVVDWLGSSAPLLDFVAALDAEFDWRGNDRILYEALGAEKAEGLIAILDLATHTSSVRDVTANEKARAPQIGRRDLFHFYDNGRDRSGLSAYHKLLVQPELWITHDAPTYLFFPVWAIQDRRYGHAALGVIGWLLLLSAFQPWSWPTVLEALPWLPSQLSSGFPAFIPGLPIVLGAWLIYGSFNWRQGEPLSTPRVVGPLWDSGAFFLFPFWALARGLYVRATVGLIALSAVPQQILMDHEAVLRDKGDGGYVISLLLLFPLLVVAGETGQRWVVYKLVRAVRAADRKRIFDPAKRAAFLRRHGTREPALARRAVRLIRDALAGLIALVIMLFVLAYAVVISAKFGIPYAVAGAFLVWGLWKIGPRLARALIGFAREPRRE